MTILTRNKVTNAGAELINSTIGGKNKISYTTAELYNKDISKLSDDQLAATTSIGTPIISGKCNVLNVTGTTVSIGSTIANGDLTADVTFCTVGWFATTSVDQANGKPPVLIAISQLDAPTTLAHGGDNGKATAYFLPKLNIGIANTTQIKLEPTEAGFVTITELQQAIIALSHSGLIDLGNRLPNGIEVNKLHNTSLQYVPKGSITGLPPLDDKKDEDKDNDDSDRGGYLMSLGNNELTQDGVQIYLNPYYNKTFISFYNSKKNLWCDWIEVGSQSYTKDEIDKMINSFASRDYVDQTRSDLINYILQGLAFTDFKIKPKAPSYSGIKIDLDDNQYKTLGIIRFSNCSIILSDDRNNIMSTINGKMDNHVDLVSTLSQGQIYSGWILNLKLNDKYLYQYVIVIDDRAATRLFKREVPIGNRASNDTYRYDLKEIEVYPQTIVGQTRLNAQRMDSLYSGNVILDKTINLDADPSDFENQVGVSRFSRCYLSTQADHDDIDYEGFLNSGIMLDGWITLLPTGTETNNNDNQNNYLQIVVCYPSASATGKIYVGYEVETYYRVKQLGSASSFNNFFHRLETRTQTNKFEVQRRKYDFNNMVDDVEGITDIISVFTRNAMNDTYYAANELGLPSFLDIIINNKNKYYGELRQRGLFKYKIRTVRKKISEDPETIQVFQRIEVFGFVFERSGNREYGNLPVWDTEWRLAGNYNPLNDLSAVQTAYAQVQINSVFLPTGTDLNKVGTSIYNETNYNHGFLPQGFYHLEGSYKNAADSNMTGFLIAISGAASCIQIYLPTSNALGIYYRSTIGGFSSAKPAWLLLKGMAV